MSKNHNLTTLVLKYGMFTYSLKQTPCKQLFLHLKYINKYGSHKVEESLKHIVSNIISS